MKSLDPGLKVPPEQQYEGRLRRWTLDIGRVCKRLEFDNRSLPLTLKHLKVDIVLIATFGPGDDIS
ncbi:hypothetical protein ACM42_11355 [Bradyrhizobium sp. CCBAU 25338]|nr:hypothetical protein [Bradyrhizobium sp. CCBAU 25338]